MSSFFTVHFPQFSSFQEKSLVTTALCFFFKLCSTTGAIQCLKCLWTPSDFRFFQISDFFIWNVLQNQSPARIKTKNTLVVRKSARSKTSTSMCSMNIPSPVYRFLNEKNIFSLTLKHDVVWFFGCQVFSVPACM